MSANIRPEPAALVATSYDRLAPRWTKWANALEPDLRREYTQLLLDRLPAGASVVELGCGTGAPVGAMVAARCRYRGIDGSAGMIAEARRNVPSGTYDVADMREAQIAPGSLDGVLSFFAIAHVPRADHASLFRHIRTWLKPGGWFAGCLAPRDDPGSLLDQWIYDEPMFWSSFDGDTNLRLLHDAGFSPIEVRVREQLEEGETIRTQWFVCSAGKEAP